MKARCFALFIVELLCLGLVIVGCGTSGNANDSPEPQYWTPLPFIPDHQWEEIASPGWVKQFCQLDSEILALTSTGLFKSNDFGISWQPITIDLPTGSLGSMDIDQGKLWITCSNGLIVSGDGGTTFSWEFHWTWDGCSGVDFLDGIGWMTIGSWGSASGIYRYLPESGWQRKASGSWADVIIDPLDPQNIAYAYSGNDRPGGRRTFDNGENWLYNRSVIYVTLINGNVVIYTFGDFSEDRGETWQSMGIEMYSAGSQHPLIKDDETGIFYVTGLHHSYSINDSFGVEGVYSGYPGNWTPCGLADKEVSAFHICGKWLLAATVAPGEIKMFRTAIKEQ